MYVYVLCWSHFDYNNNLFSTIITTTAAVSDVDGCVWATKNSRLLLLLLSVGKFAKKKMIAAIQPCDCCVQCKKSAPFERRPGHRLLLLCTNLVLLLSTLLRSPSLLLIMGLRDSSDYQEAGWFATVNPIITTYKPVVYSNNIFFNIPNLG